MVTSMTNIEKIAFLENVVVVLHKNIYAACFALEIEASALDIETYNSEQFISLFPESMYQAQHAARNTIDRSMNKLIAVNKKLDELNNA